MNHDSRADIEAIDAIISHFSDDFFSKEIQGCQSEEPIFIVGLPRTGTTLAERIIGSHSEVHAAGELNNFAESLMRRVLATHQKKPETRTQLISMSTQVDYEKLGEEYVLSTRPHTGKTQRFIDKLPLNFLYCGLIARALPKATIIHLTRHPMDACYAVYKTLFKQAYPFSYDLQELGQYYLAYRRLMQHWHKRLPGRILDISYEDLVKSQESQSKRLLSHCRLPWEDACLDFHKNPEPSMTASLAQVRQPIYASSVGRWRNLEIELQSLTELFDREGLEIRSGLSR